MRQTYIICISLFFYGYAQTIQLNEVVSSNASILFDEDDDTPDWFELYNSSDQEIDLNGYGITDDAGELDKWTFPSNNFSFLDE